MNKNVGLLDRFFRGGVGFLSAAIAMISQDIVLQVLFAVVALLGVGTAITGHCPINEKFGLNTVVNKDK